LEGSDFGLTGEIALNVKTTKFVRMPGIINKKFKP
jgi:hypothetical protein